MLATLTVVALMHWVVLATPGANVLLISQLAASGDKRAACYASVGVSLVALLWASLAVLGVHAVFTAHPHLRQTMQVAAGLYLCWFALKLWRSRAGGATGDAHAARITPAQALRLGALTNLLNPKSALFFGSVFSTALPAQPSTALLIAVVLLAFANALAWHLALAFAFSTRAVQAGYARQRTLLNRFAALVIGGFGVRLLASTAEELRGR
ncbi:MAG: LysE family transporter [Burkholderiaceae bacterium]